MTDERLGDALLDDAPDARLEELVSSLLYEGYALYPYTPGATKNATPTPFGIVYPRVYAQECSGALDHVRLECEAKPLPGASLTATLRYLSPSGERHEAREQRVTLGPAPVGERVSVEFGDLRFTLHSERLENARVLVAASVHNMAQVAAGLDRAAALVRSLISTHVIVQLSAGRFISPLETGRRSINTWPVLATETDDAVLGAAIVLPDHPEISPASHGNLFDNTEIEEALVLHVHSMTDSEREEAAAGQDPVIQAMLERTMAVTPEQIIALHSGLEETPGV